jgi:hypothetical protein
MKRILFCFLLLTGICLSGCTGQINQPDTPPSTSEESGVLPGLESEESTDMPPKESTIPGKTSKQVLTLTIDGIAVDVQWEDNDTVSELFDYVKDARIVVHTSAYGGFEQVGSFPRSFSKNDVQMTTVPGDIVLYSGDRLVVFFGSNSWSYTKLGHINLTAEKLAELLGGESTVIEFKYE